MRLPLHVLSPVVEQNCQTANCTKRGKQAGNAGLNSRASIRDLPAVAADYAVTIIDGAPRVNDLGRSAILASELVIIPITPSPFDVWAADQTVRLVQEAQQFKENIRAVFTVNRKVVNTAIGRDVADAFAGCGRHDHQAWPGSEAAREVRSLGLAITLLQKQRRAAA